MSNCSGLEIVGKREQDDLPCSECDRIGPIVVVKCGDRTYDLCKDCAIGLGLVW